jgi:hypothetical protein
MNANAALLMLAATWLAYAPAVRAGDVLAVDVTHTRGRYAVHFDVRLAAPPERLRHYLTDYRNYAMYFGPIRESTVLGGTPGERQRLRLRMRSCVLFFCRTVTVVKDIVELPDGEIRARIEPALSDFQEATEHWRITGLDGQTRLQYRAALVPDFFVPPLIGPWLLKYKIRTSLISGAEKLETLAHN